MHVNNETGVIDPINEISEHIKNKNILFHSDVVQSFGKIKIDVKEINVDSISASAHKINGPKGIGFSFVKSGTPIIPLIFGGSQERNRRGGTENVAGIVGFAEAIRISQTDFSGSYFQIKKIKSFFAEGIKQIFGNTIRINGGEETVPHILNITLLPDFYRIDAESILMFLDINNIAVSNGAACTSGTLKPSHVILNSGYSEEEANGTIRFSFGSQNTQGEIQYALEVLKKMATKFRK